MARGQITLDKLNAKIARHEDILARQRAERDAVQARMNGASKRANPFRKYWVTLTYDQLAEKAWRQYTIDAAEFDSVDELMDAMANAEFGVTTE